MAKPVAARRMRAPIETHQKGTGNLRLTLRLGNINVSRQRKNDASVFFCMVLVPFWDDNLASFRIQEVHALGKETPERPKLRRSVELRQPTLDEFSSRFPSLPIAAEIRGIKVQEISFISAFQRTLYRSSTGIRDEEFT